MRRVLMLACHFPPLNYSSTARPFHFARHLSEFGYLPCVVASSDVPGEWTDVDLVAELDPRIEIKRVGRIGVGEWLRRRVGSPERDSGSAQRDKGTAPRSEALLHRRPSAGLSVRSGMEAVRRGWRRYRKWILPAVAASLQFRRTCPYEVVWATGEPWATLIAGYWVSRLTGCPLVADIRDPWTYGPRVKRRPAEEVAWHRHWEYLVLTRAVRTVYTSPLTADVMRGRMGGSAAGRMTTITNGFADADVSPRREAPEDKLVFRYAGNLKGHRSPEILLRGLRRACDMEPALADEVTLEFLGGVEDFEGQVERCGVARQTAYLGYVSQVESRRYMRGADVLVLLQTIAGEGEDVIGGKVFEYLAARRPILAVVSETGGDAWLVRTTSSGVITGITDSQRVADAFVALWRQWRDGRLQAPQVPGGIERFNRRHLTGELAALFDEVLGERVAGQVMSGSTR